MTDEKEKQNQHVAQLEDLQKQNECITASKEQLEQQLSEALKQNEVIAAGKDELEQQLDDVLFFFFLLFYCGFKIRTGTTGGRRSETKRNNFSRQRRAGASVDRSERGTRRKQYVARRFTIAEREYCD